MRETRLVSGIRHVSVRKMQPEERALAAGINHMGQMHMAKKGIFTIKIMMIKASQISIIAGAREDERNFESRC